MLKKSIEEFSSFFADIKEGCPIIVAGNKDHNNAMMINWGGIGYLWNKKVAFIFVRKSRYTNEFMASFPDFTINFVDLNDDIIDVFGKKSGRDIDKFKESGLHRCLDIDKNVISIAEAKKVLKCHKLLAIDLDKNDFFLDNIKEMCYPTNDMHILYIAEITNYQIGGNKLVITHQFKKTLKK